MATNPLTRPARPAPIRNAARGVAGSVSSYPVYWHVGLAKTGSTYLQKCFFPQLTGLHYIDKPSRRVLSKIEAKKRVGPVLYSREMLGSWAEKTRWMARSHPEVRPIIVLRRHSDYIASWYRNELKNGRRCGFDTFVDLDHDRGVRPTRDFLFIEKLKRLDEAFEHKAYVLFYEDMKADPGRFLHNLASYLDVVYDPSKVKRQAMNQARSDKQLKAVRRLAPHLLPPHDPKGGWLRRNYRKAGSRAIIAASRFTPDSWLAHEPLTPVEKLEQIDAFYAGDWQACLDYARRHNPHHPGSGDAAI